MATNEYYCDVMTIGPGMVIMTGRFRVEGSSAPDLVVDAGPNVVRTTVARTGAGDFLVTLPKVGGGFPQEMIACLVSPTFVDATDAGADASAAGRECRYVTDSYSPTAGTFQVLCTGSTDGATFAVADPVDESEIHFFAILRREKILGQTV